ncbi:hypothetical protein M0R45_005478 [Rubus argutus]|uniref:Uncharacterized protein n=1 Tax=Rubus argutus TaxID=59490 RepID=A0AAW1YMU0_RUBAR
MAIIWANTKPCLAAVANQLSDICWHDLALQSCLQWRYEHLCLRPRSIDKLQAMNVFLLPTAPIFDRNNATPLSFVIFCKIFMPSFLGSLEVYVNLISDNILRERSIMCCVFRITFTINVYSVGLTLTSATLGAALINCLPVTTFCFAFLLMMEKGKMRTRAGIAKVLGLNSQQHYQPQNADHKDQQRWFHIFHGYYLLGLVACTSGSTSERVPCKATLLKLCLSSSIQSLCVANLLYIIHINGKKPRPSQWKLGWNIELLALAYCGSPFLWEGDHPTPFIFSSTKSANKSNKIFSICSVLGDLVATSLYSVLCGKSKEQKSMEDWSGEGGRWARSSLPVQPEKERTAKEPEVTMSPPMFV